MRFRLPTVLACLLILPLDAAARQLPTQVRVLRTGAVLLEPRGDAEFVASVSAGEVLEVLDARDGWLLVRPPQVPRPWQSGWIADALVVAIPAADTAVTRPQPGGMLALQTATGADPGGPAAWVSAGYSYTYDIDSELSFPVGIYVDGSLTLLGDRRRALGVVGELTWATRTEPIGQVTIDLSQTTFMGGVRISGGRTYVQALFGIARVSAGNNVNSFSVSDSQGMVQLGGGLNARLSSTAAVRVGADYRYSPGLRQIRILAGVALAIGGS